MLAYHMGRLSTPLPPNTGPPRPQAGGGGRPCDGGQAVSRVDGVLYPASPEWRSPECANGDLNTQTWELPSVVRTPGTGLR
jgi:hypothetical protein